LYAKLLLSKEESFLIDFLFKKNKLKNYNFSSINYELLTHISSSHMLLPLLYFKLKEQGDSEKVPTDFLRYIKEIYKINKGRNRKLIKETVEISRILNSNKINHVFLKGTANIFSNIYDDIGVRMIGDIDILVDSKDFNRTIKKFKELGYKSIIQDQILTKFYKHYPRMTKKGKLFAIEIHKEIVNPKYSNLVSSKKILEKKIRNKNIFVPNKVHQIKIQIYNHQINDYGFLTNRYNLRAMYDILKIVDTSGIEKKLYMRNNFTKHFFDLTDILTITEVNKYLNKYLIFKINLSRRFKLIYYFNNLMNEKIHIKLFKFEFKKFLKDSDYRKYIFIKSGIVKI
tara:strand:- start:1515 stop:2540 length:1026 start_codon:yes stop_codon:yes gene_type:complete